MVSFLVTSSHETFIEEIAGFGGPVCPSIVARVLVSSSAFGTSMHSDKKKKNHDDDDDDEFVARPFIKR